MKIPLAKTLVNKRVLTNRLTVGLASSPGPSHLRRGMENMEILTARVVVTLQEIKYALLLHYQTLSLNTPNFYNFSKLAMNIKNNYLLQYTYSF